MAYGADQNDGYGAPQPDTQQIYGTYATQNPPSLAANSNLPAAEEGKPAFAVAAHVKAPNTLIYLSDGTNYAVTSYWLADGALHYMTSYGAEDSVPIGEVDLQRTVDANSAQGVQFTLLPGPPGGTGKGR